MFDLNDLIPAGSNVLLQRAFYINNRGHISGLGYIGTATVGFLLTPEP